MMRIILEQMFVRQDGKRAVFHNAPQQQTLTFQLLEGVY
jgi:hypothetical protein